MKKYLLISAAILALASCKNDDQVTVEYNGVEVDPSSEILMQSPVQRKSISKVGIEGTTFPTTEKFGTKVFYLNGKDWYDSSAKWYIDDNEIAYDEDLETFRNLGKHYYWPKSGKLTFLSYYPASLKDMVSNDGGKYKVTDFVVDDGKTDLMLADIKKNMTTNDTEKGVTTAFNHKLTKVGVRARLNNTVDIDAVEIKILEIEFVDALSKGTLTDVEEGADGTWTKDDDVRSDYMYANPANGKVLKRQKDVQGSASDWYEEMGEDQQDQLILMPQTTEEMYPVENGVFAALRVKYLYTMKGTETIAEENEKIINIATMANAKDWGINKYIVYRLEFDADEILFDPKVVDFDDPEEYVDKTIK